MEYATTLERADGANAQRDAHAKTVSRQLAEQFRAVANPSFDAFRSFARDYISVSEPLYSGSPGIDSLSVSEQHDLAHALRIELPSDETAVTKGFDEFVNQLYALY